MIPILYEKNETAFASNGICRLRDCLSCVVTEERNGIYECDFDYPVTGAHYNEIVCGRIIAVTHDDSGDVQPFDIVGYTAPINGVVSFHAVHISYRLNQISSIGIEYINGRSSIGQQTPQTPDDIMYMVKNGFQAMGQWVMYPAYPSCPFSFVTDITRTDVLMFENNEPLTVRQILGGKEGGILDRFHCEFEFDRWTVHMWSNRGQQRDFVIRYGLNMTEYNDEADTSEAYNSVAPYWMNEGRLKQLQHIDSGQSLPSGRVACVPLDLSGQFSEEPTTAQLTSAARSYMNTNKTYNPAETINVSFVRLQDSEEYEQYQLLMQCGLCDTITVKFPMYNMSARMKIVKVVYDVLQERYDSMELGELSTTLSQALGVSGGSSYSGSSGGGSGADYVTEQGTSGIWTYRKWNSGIMECWGRYTASIAITTASASYGGYRSAQLNIPTLPVTYTNTPTVTATTGAAAGYWVNNVTPSTTGGQFYLSCGASLAAGNKTVNFYFIGS